MLSALVLVLSSRAWMEYIDDVKSVVRGIRANSFFFSSSLIELVNVCNLVVFPSSWHLTWCIGEIEKYISHSIALQVMQNRLALISLPSRDSCFMCEFFSCSSVPSVVFMDFWVCICMDKIHFKYIMNNILGKFDLFAVLVAKEWLWLKKIFKLF